jgi:hypothetical protein
MNEADNIVDAFSDEQGARFSEVSLNNLDTLKNRGFRPDSGVRSGAGSIGCVIWYGSWVTGVSEDYRVDLNVVSCRHRVADWKGSYSPFAARNPPIRRRLRSRHTALLQTARTPFPSPPLRLRLQTRSGRS